MRLITSFPAERLAKAEVPTFQLCLFPGNPCFQSLPFFGHVIVFERTWFEITGNYSPLGAVDMPVTLH